MRSTDRRPDGPQGERGETPQRSEGPGERFSCLARKAVRPGKKADRPVAEAGRASVRSGHREAARPGAVARESLGQTRTVPELGAYAGDSNPPKTPAPAQAGPIDPMGWKEDRAESHAGLALYERCGETATQLHAGSGPVPPPRTCPERRKSRATPSTGKETARRRAH